MIESKESDMYKDQVRITRRVCSKQAEKMRRYEETKNRKWMILYGVVTLVLFLLILDLYLKTV